MCGRNLITGLTSAASPMVDISSTCKLGQKLGVSLPLLTCSPSAWPSRLLYRRGRKSRRDLLITLYLLAERLYSHLYNVVVSKCVKSGMYIRKSWAHLQTATNSKLCHDHKTITSVTIVRNLIKIIPLHGSQYLENIKKENCSALAL
jgi:hypothetical protein